MRKRIFNSNFANKIISMLLASAMVFTSCEAFTPLVAYAAGEEEHGSGDETSEPVNAVDKVEIGIDSYPDVDILLTKGETVIDAIDFKSSVEQALREKGLDLSKIHVYAESSSDLQQDGTFAWTQYSAIGAKGYSGTVKNGAGEDPLRSYRSGSIQVSPMGSYSNVYFYGNWMTQGSLLNVAPVPEPQPGYVVNRQSVAFDYSVNFGDSMTGAGYIINAYVEGNYLVGQMLGIMNGNSAGTAYGFYANGASCALYEFEYPLSFKVVNNTGTKTSNAACHGTYHLVSRYSLAKTGSIRVMRQERELKVYGGTDRSHLQLLEAVNLSNLSHSKIGDRFGYFMQNYDHGCSNTGQFSLTNLAVDTQSRIPFNQVLTNGSSKLINNDLHFVVNIDDKADSSLESMQLMSLIDADKGYDGLHYIGWGNDNTNGQQMKNLLKNTSVVVSQHEKALLTDQDYDTGMYYTDSNGVLRRYRGLYLSQQQYNYQFYDLVQETAEYIYRVVLKYMNKDDVVVENPAKLFVNPVSKAYDTAVSPGIYSYGKWTVNHYSKVYEGNDLVNKDIYGRHDLIDVDGDGVSASNVWTHEDKQSKYETQERVGHFKDVVVGRTSKDDQIYRDDEGTLFKYSYDFNDYVLRSNGKLQKPKGNLVGTIKTGEHTEARLVDYRKVTPSTKYQDGDGATRTTIDSKTMHYVGTYLVFSDWGEYASNNSWISLPALNTSGQAVYAWSLDGFTNTNAISTSKPPEYYPTKDTVRLEGKKYYVYDREKDYVVYSGEFKPGVVYYERIGDYAYFRTQDTVANHDKVYYAYGKLTEWKPGSSWGWDYTSYHFVEGRTYYERVEGMPNTYKKSYDPEKSSWADIFKTYYYFDNPESLTQIGVWDDFITIIGQDYPYYEYTEDSKYFRTADDYPESNKTYYYKNSRGQYKVFNNRGHRFNSGTIYYERKPETLYLPTNDKVRQAGKLYYYKDGNGNYIRFQGLTFDEGVTYYEFIGTNEEDQTETYYGYADIYSPRNPAIDNLKLTVVDAETDHWGYNGRIVKGTIRPVEDSFNVTPVDGDNTTTGANRLFYVKRQQVDGNNAGLTHQYAGTGISEYFVGKFQYWDPDINEYCDTGYQTFQLMDCYSSDDYTSEPVYKDFLVEDFDPIVTSGLPVLGDMDMNYRYDNDLSLYSPTSALVGDDSDEVGLFEIFFEDELIKSVFVHRLPHAKFRLKLGQISTSGSNTGTSTLEYINQSFDYDHYYSDSVMDGGTKLPGIVEFLWEYRVEGGNWQIGKLPGRIDRTRRYEVRLTVWDREGEFSQSSVMIGNGDDPPVAQFAISGENVTVSKGIKTVECNKEIWYDDMSYDPNGYNLDIYRWVVYFKGPNDKNSVQILTQDNSFPKTLTNGPGTYTYTLQVMNSKGVWSNVASDAITATKPKVNLIYNKNLDSVNQYGVKSKRVFTYENATIDPKNNYGRRVGWDFIGWGATPTSTTVYDDVTNPLYIQDKDVTIYATFKRDLQLILANDPIAVIGEQTYNKRIYTRDTAFNFTEIKNGNKGTTRDDVTYKITYAQNDDLDGHKSTVVSTGTTETSTEIVNNVATATRTLNGWYTGYEGTEGAVKLGNPGTTIKVTPQEYAATVYTVEGDVGSAIYDSNDKRVFIYPQWNHAYVKLPDCTRREENRGVNGKDEDKFLGWFTQPQPPEGGSGDGGVYAGKPGDVIEIVGDITLYPWFNIAPTIVHSAIEDGFYEDQPVSYEQLMTLVDAYDTDDWTDAAIDGLITYNGVDAWIKLFALNAEVWLDENFPTMTAEEKQAILDNINYEDFTPEITHIEFACNVDEHGKPCASNPDTQDIDDLRANGLATTKNHLGDLIITYTITDHGQLSNGSLIPDSPITVNYKLHTKINWNNPPKLELVSKYLYSVDENLNSDNIEEFLLRSQIVRDAEDDTTKSPWWYKDDVEFDNPSDNTQQRLFDALRIVKIYDIKFQSSYEADHAAECATVKDYSDIKQLFALKDTNLDLFKHILSFKVEVDTHDQWNKYANGRVYDDWDSYLADSENSIANQNPEGMNLLERTFEVIMFNNHDDYDLLNYIIQESMRYVDSANLSTLKENSFWGDTGYGLDDVKAVLDKYGLSLDDVATFSGNVQDANNRNVTITVHDYSGDNN